MSLTSYREEKLQQHLAIICIIIAFCIFTYVRFERIGPNLSIYIVGVMCFVLLLFGYELMLKATEVKKAWITESIRQEGFAERRREKFRKNPEPWRAFVPLPTPQQPSCPNVLVRKQDGKFYLYNTSLPDTVITNPIVFKTISEYITYWKQQRDQGGLQCPIAYLQQDLSGDDQYYEVQLDKELRDATMMDRLSKQVKFYLPKETQSEREPQPTEMTDAQRRGFDRNTLPSPPFGAQEQGVWTEKDEKGLRSQFGGYPVSEQQTATGAGIGIPAVSTNPMDSNWGGGYYSKLLRDEGYFRHSSKANV